MKAAQWLALGAGAGLGVLAACFTPPDLTGPYLCSPQRTCPGTDLSCVNGLCCDENGGEPACPTLPDGGPPDSGVDGGVPDGGPDAGPGPDGGVDGGADAGQDAGCTASGACTVPGLFGLCANGQFECDGGVPYCKQTVLPRTEICNNSADDDCDGVIDDYPCHGGPPNLLSPNPGYVMGAQDTATPVGSLYSGGCLYNNSNIAQAPGYLDGGNWRGSGTNSHFFYAMADGGAWDLTTSKLKITFSGAFIGPINLANPVSYFQPVVWICGPNASKWARYNPRNPPSGEFQITGSGAGFLVDTTITLDGGDLAWNPTASQLTDLTQITRVEVLITLADPFDGGNPAYDAGITTFGFSPP